MNSLAVVRMGFEVKVHTTVSLLFRNSSRCDNSCCFLVPVVNDCSFVRIVTIKDRGPRNT
jgi:hypothetical protein